MTKIIYTDSMLAELKAMGTITYETAQVFADKHGISVRSVVAKVRAIELPYQPKVTTGEKKSKVIKASNESKADIAAEIEAMLRVSFKKLDNLVLEDLVKLRNVVKIAL